VSGRKCEETRNWTGAGWTARSIGVRDIQARVRRWEVSGLYTISLAEAKQACCHKRDSKPRSRVTGTNDDSTGIEDE
jgi:hypothetical protein